MLEFEVRDPRFPVEAEFCSFDPFFTCSCWPIEGAKDECCSFGLDEEETDENAESSADAALIAFASEFFREPKAMKLLLVES